MFRKTRMLASTEWALLDFSEWKNSRKALFNDEPGKQVPETILTSTDPKVLSKWLSLYVAETRKRDGTQYPAETISAERYSSPHGFRQSPVSQFLGYN